MPTPEQEKEKEELCTLYKIQVVFQEKRQTLAGEQSYLLMGKESATNSKDNQLAKIIFPSEIVSEEERKKMIEMAQRIGQDQTGLIGEDGKLIGKIHQKITGDNVIIKIYIVLFTKWSGILAWDKNLYQSMDFYACSDFPWEKILHVEDCWIRRVFIHQRAKPTFISFESDIQRKAVERVTIGDLLPE